MSSVMTVDRAVARHLADCAMDGGSGILSAVRGKLRRLFCLEKGTLVFALSNVIEEQIHETLVQRRLVTPSDLVAAQRQSREQGERLTRVLVDDGAVALEVMKRQIEAQVRRLLFHTLSLPKSLSMPPPNPGANPSVIVRLLTVKSASVPDRNWNWTSNPLWFPAPSIVEPLPSINTLPVIAGKG